MRRSPCLARSVALVPDSASPTTPTAQIVPPNVEKMMDNGMSMPDINSPEVQEQFAQMGMKPEDVLTKIMQDPELAQSFQNPKVQQAVMDCSTNPMNITKYQDDPEIMSTFEKLAAMFPQDMSNMGQ